MVSDKNPHAISRKPLPMEVEAFIIKQMKNGTYQPKDKLPSEGDLMEILDVSRTTIRAAYHSLQAKGLIDIKHGKGSYVKRLPSISNTYEYGLDVIEILLLHGYKPNFIQYKSEIIKAGKQLASKMDLEIESEILEVIKVFSADDIPIIIFINQYPAWIFSEIFTMSDAMHPGITEPPDLFLSNYCNINLEKFNSILKPEIISNIGFSDLLQNRDQDESLLKIEDIGIDDLERVVFRSIELLLGEAAQFEFTRPITPT